MLTSRDLAIPGEHKLVEDLSRDVLGSGNYALIYQPSCDLNNQTVIIEVLEEGKTLYTRSVRFDIEQ